ncbi:hypothetical protein QR674_07820 [Acinetobacter chinensis]|uniref:Uncharacterized protein n=1 Tax=Acinetobacter chinensis TaxID=2004650 RepID=A0ABU3WEQ1_9GAMM|nr:hypothetical protein [Acinetobacter chinensis]MDV2468889.1 hypothetical protein [Acinetobacter chinensis]
MLDIWHLAHHPSLCVDPVFVALLALTPEMQSKYHYGIQDNSTHTLFHFDRILLGLHSSETQAPNDTYHMILCRFAAQAVYLD